MEKEVIYVGFTGPMGAGKGTAIEALHNSLSHVVREEATARGIKHERQNLINLGNELREQYSDGVLAHKVANTLEHNRYAYEIIDGIRHPKEVEALRDRLENFVLIAVVASPQSRYERILGRNRASDPDAIDEIAKKDENDRAIGIDECIKIADYRIYNGKMTQVELRTEVEKCLENYTLKLKVTSAILE